MREPSIQRLDKLFRVETESTLTGAFNSAVERRDGFVVFGAGRLGRRVLHALRSNNVEAVAFTDSNPALWGTTIRRALRHAAARSSAKI